MDLGTRCVSSSGPASLRAPPARRPRHFSRAAREQGVAGLCTSRPLRKAPLPGRFAGGRSIRRGWPAASSSSALREPHARDPADAAASPRSRCRAAPSPSASTRPSASGRCPTWTCWRSTAGPPRSRRCGRGGYEEDERADHAWSYRVPGVPWTRRAAPSSHVVRRASSRPTPRAGRTGPDRPPSDLLRRSSRCTRPSSTGSSLSLVQWYDFRRLLEREAVDADAARARWPRAPRDRAVGAALRAAECVVGAPLAAALRAALRRSAAPRARPGRDVRSARGSGLAPTRVRPLAGSRRASGCASRGDAARAAPSVRTARPEGRPLLLAPVALAGRGAVFARRPRALGAARPSRSRTRCSPTAWPASTGCA